MSSANLTYPQMRIREWLLCGRRFKALQAARELEVSRRTIAQDIECLRAPGYDIEYDAKLPGERNIR